MKEKKKMSLAMQIFIALVLAIIAGLLMQNYTDFAESYIKPFGTIFLNLIKFIVVPIVLFSIMCGIISMSDIKKVGSIGLKTVVFYLCTTAFAVTIGLVGGNLFRGLFPVVATTDLSYEAAEATSFMDTLVNFPVQLHFTNGRSQYASGHRNGPDPWFRDHSGWREKCPCCKRI